MIFFTKMFWKCMFSPKLYVLYRESPEEVFYKYHNLEMWSERILSTANTIMNIGMYTSPFICLYLYRRGFMAENGFSSLAILFGTVGSILFTSFLIRAYFRSINPKYTQFLLTLKSEPKSANYMDNIRKYDFDFHSWPASYKMPQYANSRSSLASPFNTSANEDLPVYPRTALQLLAYIAVNTFALRLVYPGTIGIIQQVMWGHLIEGRTQLVQHHNGKRNKLIASDGNTIDTMFVDNRPRREGDTLVICCEGNSGFYEVGIMGISIRAGYSTLGWNHPGFASSTGLPYPPQEHNAIDAVMRFAIEELKFKPENIVMFGWSIGGYSAAWAANNYPVKGIVLDATFDDLLPLAQKTMPASWSLLVKEVIRSHIDLHVSKLVKNFSGPVHFIRRTQDEIISTEPGVVSTNRGNFLVIDVLKHRYPEINEHYTSQLTNYANMLAERRPDINSIRLTAGEKYVLNLLLKYTTDFQATHCTMLPPTMFAEIMRSHIMSTQPVVL